MKAVGAEDGSVSNAHIGWVAVVSCNNRTQTLLDRGKRYRRREGDIVEIFDFTVAIASSKVALMTISVDLTVTIMLRKEKRYN